MARHVRACSEQKSMPGEKILALPIAIVFYSMATQ
jgi:hypothetical protein